MKKWIVLLIVGIVFIGLTNSAMAQGCSQCKLLTEQGSELTEDSFGSNINYGILYLMIIPYLLLMFLFRNRIYQFFKRMVKK